ncbi:MAG: hypothetical protein BWY88_00899 [Synergistetes bacterium ADurb.Bin520]|nr:MAG: hypothetical protein BWY88_00899 [Synergistetes bacterium ADurb.Bin520]
MHGEPLLTIRELRGHLAVILIGGKGPRDLEDPDGLGRSSGKELDLGRGDEGGAEPDAGGEVGRE